MRRMMLQICAILSSFILNNIRAETIKTTKSCLTTDEDRIPLTCYSGEMIHVISFLYQTASENCNTVDGECQVLQQSLDDGLLLSCNGHQTCNETISNNKMKKECNHTTPVHVTIKYGCVSESPVDVCTETSQTFGQQVYLISPDYLRSNNDFPSVPCECALSGSDISVEILELSLPFFLEDRANITLLGDSGSWTSSPVPNFIQYNKLVLNETENVALFYDARGKTGQHMWLRLQGSANITVQCNRQPTTTQATTLSTPAAPQLNVTGAELGTSGKPVTRTNTKTDENAEKQTVVIGILIGIIVLLVLASGAILLFFLYIKPRRPQGTEIGQNHVTGQNNEADTTNNEEPSYYNVTNTSNTSSALELEPRMDVDTGNENYEHLATYTNDPTNHDYSSLT